MITQRADSISSPRRIPGWAGVSFMALGFFTLFLLNYLVPLRHSSYTMRLWDWTELALAAGALLVVALRWRAVPRTAIWIGAALGLISGLSQYLHNQILWDAFTEAGAVWLTFLGGAALFQTLKERRVDAFQPPLPGIARGIGFGVLAAIPLAVVNNLFFFLQNGTPQFQSITTSAVEALSPGIHEEVVFRYFILAVCMTLFRGSAHPRLALAATIVMAVVPHSLLHLPDLLLSNPLMGVGMLFATSLLFGLPMALLQTKRSFEAAAAFHWAIDFFRFFFGY